MTNKMTKRDYFTALKGIEAVAANAELVAFIDHELELLAKKNTSRSTELTETQKENLVIADSIIEFMKSTGTPVTIAMIRKHNGLSSQRITPIMTNLEKQGKISRDIQKRVSYFTVVEEA